MNAHPATEDVHQPACSARSSRVASAARRPRMMPVPPPRTREVCPAGAGHAPAITVAGDPAAPDTTAPVVSARVDSSSLRALEQRKALLLTLSSSEAVTTQVTVRAFDTTLAKGKVSVASGATAIALKLTSAGLRG